jgi:hypothetical protein
MDNEAAEKLIAQLALLSTAIKEHIAMAKAAVSIEERDRHLDEATGAADMLPDLVDGVGFIEDGGHA